MRTFHLMFLFFSAAISAVAQGDFQVYESSIKQDEGNPFPAIVIISGGQKFTFRSPPGLGAQTDEPQHSITFSAQDGTSAMTLQITTNYPGKLPEDSVLKSLALKRFPDSQVIQAAAARAQPGSRFVEMVRVPAENMVVKITDVFIPFSKGMIEVVYSANNAQYEAGKISLQQVLMSLKIDAAPMAKAVAPTPPSPALPVQVVFSSAEPPRNEPPTTNQPSSTESVPAVALPGICALLEYKNPDYPWKPTPGQREDAQKDTDAAAIEARQWHYSEAIRAYQKAVIDDPSFFDARLWLGVASLKAGDVEGALDAFYHAAVIQPDSADARYDFAFALQKGKYYRDAAAQLEDYLQKFDPNEMRAHLLLGELYAGKLHKPKLARKHYVKIVEINPRHPQASAIGHWLEQNPK